MHIFCSEALLQGLYISRIEPYLVVKGTDDDMALGVMSAEGAGDGIQQFQMLSLEDGIRNRVRELSALEYADTLGGIIGSGGYALFHGLEIALVADRVVVE